MDYLRGSSSNVWLLYIEYFIDQPISYSKCVFYSFRTILLFKTTNENVINRAHWLTGPALMCFYLRCGGTPQQAVQGSILKRKVLFACGTSLTSPVWLGTRNNFLLISWRLLLQNFSLSRIQAEEKPYDFYYFTTPAKKRLTGSICPDYILPCRNPSAYNE